MTLAHDASLALKTRFKVVVDGIDLGGWQACEGLEVDFKPFMVQEGGENGYLHVLPGCLEYSHIKLTRAMTASDSPRVQQWLAQKADSFDGGTAQITLLDAHAKPVHAWSLRNVYPAKWTGPSMDAMTSGVAIETLTLVHEGFL
jgi:phage tail-like protein